ncbi:MAG: TAXI family TRAP transporter solute-binding subunit, partial [Acidilobaceae archaeon]
MAVSRIALITGIIIVLVLVAGAIFYLQMRPAPTTTPTPTPTPVTPYTMKIFTGGTGGVYYPLGVKLADMLSKYSGGRITATATTSGASVANVRALQAGDANLIFVQNDIA